jgi:succinoglycan biosynthesis transport protein ExoP
LIDSDAPPRVVSIEDANIPQGNDAMRKYVTVGFAGVTGFAAVLFGIAVLEFQSRRLNSEREVREGLGIRVIGHLPSLSARSWRKLADTSSATSAHLQSLLMESVDSIRATLVHSNGSNPPRIVMVSSSDIQEGKTTVASQLAASLARAGRRTLLLDADLRNPSAHVVFGLPLGPGFAEVLRGDAEKEAAVYATPAPNLWLMPSGQYDSSTTQAISGESLIHLIKSLKEQYDFVIVDAPPVLKVADPLIFGQCVDAAVISVRRDVSQIPKIYEACERLKTVGVNVLGVIVNGVNDKPVKRSAPIHA